MKNIILNVFWYIVTGASLINIYAFIDYVRMSTIAQGYTGGALLVVYIPVATVLIVTGLILGIYLYHIGNFYKAYTSIGLAVLLLIVGGISFI